MILQIKTLLQPPFSGGSEAWQNFISSNKLMHYRNFACFRGTRSRQYLSGTYGSGFSFAGTSSAPVFSENLTEAPPLLGRVPLAAKSTSGAVLRIIIKINCKPRAEDEPIRTMPRRSVIVNEV